MLFGVHIQKPVQANRDPGRCRHALSRERVGGASVALYRPEWRSAGIAADRVKPGQT
jgi:hypothetical protein